MAARYFMYYEGVASATLHGLVFEDIRWHFCNEEWHCKYPKISKMEIKTSGGDAGYYTPISIMNRDKKTCLFVVNQAIEFMEKNKLDYCSAAFDGDKPVFAGDHGFIREEIKPYF